MGVFGRAEESRLETFRTLVSFFLPLRCVTTIWKQSGRAVTCELYQKRARPMQVKVSKEVYKLFYGNRVDSFEKDCTGIKVPQADEVFSHLKSLVSGRSDPPYRASKDKDDSNSNSFCVVVQNGPYDESAWPPPGRCTSWYILCFLQHHGRKIWIASSVI